MKTQKTATTPAATTLRAQAAAKTGKPSTKGAAYKAAEAARNTEIEAAASGPNVDATLPTEADLDATAAATHPKLEGDRAAFAAAFQAKAEATPAPAPRGHTTHSARAAYKAAFGTAAPKGLVDVATLLAAVASKTPIAEAPKAPKAPKAKVAGELPFGTASGPKAAHLRDVYERIKAGNVSGADGKAISLHHMAQAVASFEAPPDGGWTRGALTDAARCHVKGYSYTALESALNGVGIALAQASKAAKPTTSPVDAFKAHLASMTADEARLLLAEIGAAYITAPAAHVDTDNRGALLELD